MPTKKDLLESLGILLAAPAVILILMLADADISILDLQWALGTYFG